MSKDDTISYSFRLNLNNPDHLLVHQTLMNLNTDVYGSKSQFIINSLVSFIKGTGSDMNGGWYVTREEMDRFKDEITNDIKTEVLSETMKILFSAVSGEKAEKKE